MSCRAPAGLAVVLAEHDIDADDVLARARLPRDTLAEPRRRLTIEGYFALWQAIAATGVSGAALGASYPEHTTEPAFLACIGSRTLGEMLERLARYKRTLAPESLEVRTSKHLVSLRYGWPSTTLAPPRILVEAELTFLLALARKATRLPLEDARVDLARKVLWLPRAATALPFATYNPTLLAMLEPALLVARDEDDTTSSVRMTLLRSFGDGEPTIAQVASELGLSVRTLQRQLADQGTSFASLLQDVRRDRAEHYLGETALTLSEIAYLLGFDTPSSFFRAFARWTGQTPSGFRATLSPSRRRTTTG